ncbi:MAG: hypothetical protein ACR2O4_08655 [Hyphomicrobiaceae bacterium]
MRLSRKAVHQACTAAAVAALTVLPSQISVAAPAESGWQVTVETVSPKSAPSGVATEPFRMRLGFSDERAALQALQFALNEVGDGATFVWHRKAGAVSGTVRPTAVFIDDKQRLCRHVVFSLSAGDRTSTIEGIACRTKTGLWQL